MIQCVTNELNLRWTPQPFFIRCARRPVQQLVITTIVTDVIAPNLAALALISLTSPQFHAKSASTPHILSKMNPNSAIQLYFKTVSFFSA